jgi:S23 ribosomal protein.
MFNFEELDVWQEAIQFADLVYESTCDFPDQERFGLTNQMGRAAVSISSNLAEGSSRVSRTDFGRFVEIATGSLFEVVSQTTIALRRRMIAENDTNAFTRQLKNRAKCSTDCAGRFRRHNSQPSTTNYQPPDYAGARGFRG